MSLSGIPDEALKRTVWKEHIRLQQPIQKFYVFNRLNCGRVFRFDLSASRLPRGLPPYGDPVDPKANGKDFSPSFA
ncbi:hypothetical protein [Pararhizobium arenae]|uniref:hypothetical protein n=1 Tax=Pararhizobium arenae TaxID=1856850 RepID=UPI00117AC832|nr:hypothetical protein [Pararhizobium arenae]